MIAAVLLCATALLGAGESGEDAEAPPLKNLACVRAESAIEVDGQSGEDAWESVAPVTDFRVWNTLEAPIEAVSVRCCYDDEAIYFLFECADPDVCAVNEGRDAWLWESDNVELFFKPVEDSIIYYEFEVSPLNDIFDARFVNTGSGGFKRWSKWDCDMETAVSVRGTVNDWKDTDEGYTVEIAIPIKTFEDAIGDEPLKGQTWKFAAVRTDASVTLESIDRSATANVQRNQMHDPESWFNLSFE